MNIQWEKNIGQLAKKARDKHARFSPLVYITQSYNKLQRLENFGNHLNFVGLYLPLLFRQANEHSRKLSK